LIKKQHIAGWIRYGLIISAFILLVNTATLFNLTAAKTGSINFFEPGDHVITFFYAWLAFIATLLSWKIAGKFEQTLGTRVIWTFLTGLLIYWVFATLFYIAVRAGYYGLYIDAGYLLRNIIFSFSLAYLHISGLTLAWLYFKTSRDLAIEKQKLEKEMQNLQSRLLAKNLEPHFLMNSLSFISSTMKSNPDEAENFLDSFSNVYRYFLKHNASDLVPLSEELRFLDKYITLMEKRFGEAYQFSIQVEDTSGNVLPFSLQMCVENAVKHNSGSAEDPLEIKLERKNSHVKIINNVQPAGDVLTTGLGLENLSRRLDLMLGQELEFHASSRSFEVLIPVIPDVNAGTQRPESR
jgi:two-component system, LytTR family, sensor kinase